MRISKAARFLLAATALTLAGCFPVEDLGNSWAKARMDPRLAGSWRTVAVFGDPPGGAKVGQIVQFTAADGA